MKSFRTAAVLLLAMLVLVPAGTAALAQEQPGNDEVMRIANDVRKAILRLPEYGVFDNLSFSVRDSIVILQGYASRPVLKTSAERVTLKVKGVEEVLNNIEVLPLSSFDDKLRARLYVNIYGHSALSRLNPNRGTPTFQSMTRRTSGITNDPPPGRHPIHIIVNNGHVTLEGFVDSAGLKAIAEIQASATPGVFSVTNDIVIPEEEVQ